VIGPRGVLVNPSRSRDYYLAPRLLFASAVRRAFGGLFIAMLSACAPQPELDEPARATQAITGGAVDTNDSAIVLLYAEDGASAFICTAALIAPKVLLTAAHCVSSTLHSAATKYYAFYGNDLNAARPGDLHPIAEVHAHPAWDVNKLVAGHDVGVAILKDAATMPPLPLRRTALQVSELGRSLRLVGYGATDGASQAGTGIKRETQTGLDDFDDFTLTYNDASHLTCNGDSGGPALLVRNGVEEIVGLTSFGDETCVQYGVDTRVDAELAFIDPLIEMAQHPPPARASTLVVKQAEIQYVGGDFKADEPPTGGVLDGGCSMARTARDRCALVPLLVLVALLCARRRL
jgi:V8-like Glu-specific endopeptidase